MGLSLSFSDLSKCASPREFVEKKMMDFLQNSNATLTAEPLDKIVQAILSAPKIEPRLENRELLHSAPEKAAREIDAVTTLFARRINKLSPLLDNERSLVDDLCSCLAEPFAGYPKGTAVFKRTTNQCTLYYFEPMVTVDVANGFTVHHATQTESYDIAPVEQQVQLLSLSWMSILLAIAKGAIGAIGGKIGTAILDEIFGKEQLFDYDKALKDFRNIIKEELIHNDVAKEGGRINGIIADINEQRHFSAKSGMENAFDINKLSDYITRLNESIGILMINEYRALAVPLFILAVNSKHCTYQEMALVDKSAKVREGVKTSIKDSCGKAITHLTECYRIIAENKTAERLAKVVKKHQTEVFAVLEPGEQRLGVSATVYWFEDTGCQPVYKSEVYSASCSCQEASDAPRNKAMDAYKEKLKNSYVKTIASELKFITDEQEMLKMLQANQLPGIG